MYNASNEYKKLVEQAASARDSQDAMRFSQAACNIANAMLTVQTLEKYRSY